VTPPGRPPWWPEGEHWPPRGHRRGPPRGVVRYLALAGLVWLAFSALIGVVAGEAVAHGAGWVAGALLLGVGCLAVVSGLRGPRWRVGHRLRELSEAARRLEATDARRRTFLAELAHELRTPLAVVRAQTEAIADGVYPGDAEHLAPVLEATGAMEALVADLRTLAESEAGALSLDRGPLAVEDLLAETAAAHRGEADAARVRLAVEAAPGLPPVDGDAARLRRVLGNLVGNAITHTSAGGSVVVAARRSGQQVAVSVSDTGEGMEPALAERAFERFVKAPGSRGSGLGLSIAKDIVEAHGGEIRLESRPGAGTTVTLTLPVA
jgi:two-component system sensor histidine kinase BaeS